MGHRVTIFEILKSSFETYQPEMQEVPVKFAFDGGCMT